MNLVLCLLFLSHRTSKNLQKKLKTLSFKDGKYLENHFSSLLSILDELKSLDISLGDSGKGTKLLRRLTVSFLGN